MPIDYKRYPPNWKTEIRPAVLARAGNCCEFCGRKNGMIVYSARIDKRMEWFNTPEEVYEQGLPTVLAEFYVSRSGQVNFITSKTETKN